MRRFVGRASGVLVLVLSGCGAADSPPPDAGDPPPVIGPWSCTYDFHCYEFYWLYPSELDLERRTCARFAGGRCARRSPAGQDFTGRCDWSRDPRYRTPRATVLYGSRDIDRDRAECEQRGTWQDAY